MITHQGIDFIKKFEGFSSLPYTCSAGVLTIGYGHAIKQGESFPCGITEETAEELLYDDLAIAEQAIFDYVKCDLLPTQFDALTSFIFNVGVGNFKKSTLLRCLNSYEYGNAESQFNRWVYADGKVVKGLVRRREAETKLFAEGVYD